MSFKNYRASTEFPPHVGLAWSTLIEDPGVAGLPIPLAKGQATRMRQLMYMYRKALQLEGLVEGERLSIYSLHVEADLKGGPGLPPGSAWTIRARQDEVGQALMQAWDKMGTVGKIKPADRRKIEEIQALAKPGAGRAMEDAMEKIGFRPPSTNSLTTVPVTVRDGGTTSNPMPMSAVDAAMEAKRQIEAGELDEVLKGMDEPPADPLLLARWRILGMGA